MINHSGHRLFPLRVTACFYLLLANLLIFGYQLPVHGLTPVTIPFLVQQQMIEVVVTDAKTKDPISGATVYIKKREGKVLAELISDSKGIVTVPVDPNTDYVLITQKQGYFESLKSVKAPSRDNDTPKIVNIGLISDPGYSVVGTIFEKGTTTPIESVTVTLTDLGSKSQSVHFTNPEGAFRKPLEDQRKDDVIHYEIRLDKMDYLTKTVEFKKKIDKEGEISLNEYLKNISMIPIDLGADLGQLIGLNPIYFRVNEYHILPDAAAELDRIIEVLEENPTLIIELGSHTDSRGSDAYNKSLSDQRAKASVDYIRKHGIAAHRISGKGYGETQLLNNCGNDSECSEEKHQINRRTEFKIVQF